MTSKTYTVSELLNTFSLWTKNAHGCDVLLVDDKGRSITAKISNSDITERHPNLVHVLSHWHNERVGLTPNPYINSNSIANILRHWEQPIIIHDTEGVEFVVAHVDEVSDPDEAEVLLEVTAGKLAYAGEIAYISDTYDESIVIEAAKLEELYPGWRARLDIALSLEGEEDDAENDVANECDRLLTSYVFSSSPFVPKVDMPLPDIFD